MIFKIRYHCLLFVRSPKSHNFGHLQFSKFTILIYWIRTNIIILNTQYTRSCSKIRELKNFDFSFYVAFIRNKCCCYTKIWGNYKEESAWQATEREGLSPRTGSMRVLGWERVGITLCRVEERREKTESERER